MQSREPEEYEHYEKYAGVAGKQRKAGVCLKCPDDLRFWRAGNLARHAAEAHPGLEGDCPFLQHHSDRSHHKFREQPVKPLPQQRRRGRVHTVASSQLGSRLFGETFDTHSEPDLPGGVKRAKREEAGQEQVPAEEGLEAGSPASRECQSQVAAEEPQMVSAGCQTEQRAAVASGPDTVAVPTQLWLDLVGQTEYLMRKQGHLKCCNTGAREAWKCLVCRSSSREALVELVLEPLDLPAREPSQTCFGIRGADWETYMDRMEMRHVEWRLEQAAARDSPAGKGEAEGSE
jgi:hypothetical protein